MIRETINPAATQIVKYLQQLLSQIDVKVEAQPVGFVPREINAHINIAVVDDTAFDEWTSIDAQGRSLEVDIECRVKGSGVSYDEAKALAARVEQLIMANNGSHAVGGGRVRAERATEASDGNREGEQDMLLLPVQYSFLHRVVRGAPDVLK